MLRSYFYYRMPDCDVHSGYLKASYNTFKHNYNISGVQICKNHQQQQINKKRLTTEAKDVKESHKKLTSVKALQCCFCRHLGGKKRCSESKKTLYFQCFFFCAKTWFQSFGGGSLVLRCALLCADSRCPA